MWLATVRNLNNTYARLAGLSEFCTKRVLRKRLRNSDPQLDWQTALSAFANELV
jgi:hypothetical protein